MFFWQLTRVVYRPGETRVHLRTFLAPQWKLFVDDSSTSSRSGAGLIIIILDNFKFTQALRFSFKANNNQVEYQALIVGLHLTRTLQVQNLAIFNDSHIVVRQQVEIRLLRMLVY